MVVIVPKTRGRGLGRGLIYCLFIDINISLVVKSICRWFEVTFVCLV